MIPLYVQNVSLIEDNIEYILHDIITEAYKETYDKISMVCGDTRPCSPHVDEGLESLLPCNILSEKDCYEYKEDMDRQEHDAMDEESPTLFGTVAGDKYFYSQVRIFFSSSLFFLCLMNA